MRPPLVREGLEAGRVARPVRRAEAAHERSQDQERRPEEEAGGG